MPCRHLTAAPDLVRSADERRQANEDRKVTALDARAAFGSPLAFGPGLRRGSGLHLFRHTAASLVHRHTGSLKFAQALLRHARVSTTANVYTHVSASESRDLAQALEGAIFSNCSLPVLTNGRVTAHSDLGVVADESR